MTIKLLSLFVLSSLLLACGHENTARTSQFDVLEQSAQQKALPYKSQQLDAGPIQIKYPNFGTHPFSKLLQQLLMSDTAGVFCVGQRSANIRYQTLWATKNVLSMQQEIVLDCPMSQGKRSTTITHLYTLLNDTIYKLDLEGSPSVIQEIQVALKKRQAPYCSPPKIEEVFPYIRKGRVEITPHYGSALCDTTFKRSSISRKDLRLIRNQVFLVLKP